MTDKSGPLRQRNLFEWNLPGNLNIGGGTTSTGSSLHPTVSSDSTGSQDVRKTGQQVIPDEDPHRAILLERDDEEGDPLILWGME